MFGVVLLAFVIFYVLTQPVASADAVKGAGGVVSAAAGSLSTFVSSLFS